MTQKMPRDMEGYVIISYEKIYYASYVNVLLHLLLTNSDRVVKENTMIFSFIFKLMLVSVSKQIFNTLTTAETIDKSTFIEGG